MAEEDRFSKDFPVTWEELHRDSKALAWRLLDRGAWLGVLGIARGGLVPAAIVARELDIRVVATISVSSYDHQTQGAARVLFAPEIAEEGEGWVIVDDLVDTGATARLVRRLFPRAHLATVYAKPAGRPLVDTFVTEVSQDTWIHFPWDLSPQFVQPIASLRQGR